MVYIECVLQSSSTTNSEVPLAVASETEEGIKKDRFAASFASCLLVRYNIVQYVHVHMCHTFEYGLASVS